MTDEKMCGTCNLGRFGNCGKCTDEYEHWSDKEMESIEQILDRINGKVTHYHNGERYIKWSDAKQAMKEYHGQYLDLNR